MKGIKKAIFSAMFAFGIVVGVEAAPTDTVTKADLQALIDRITKLEAENKAQAAKIRELEARDGELAKKTAAVELKTTEIAAATPGVGVMDEGTTTNETGRIFTTAQGFKYYLADKGKNIFEPLSESGLKLTPYGYLVFEAVHTTRGTEADIYADWVRRDSDSSSGHQTVFSVQDSILGLQFETPERRAGWTFTGRAEFDLAGDHSNDYQFHWRHLYVNAEHETGWSILFGQTWHLWKMVTPSEIDGAWMENTGHPYRRSPQFRITKKWAWEESSLEWRIGMVKGGPGMGGDRDSDGQQDNAASAWPLFETALMYDRDVPWEEKGSGKRWLIGLGGMYGQDRSRRRSGIAGWDNYGDPIYAYDGDYDDYNSQMIMVAGKVPYRDFTLTGQFFAGENLGGVQAGIGQRVGYTEGVYDQKGSEVRTMGGFLDLAYQLNYNWSFAIGYGFDDPNNSDAKKAEGRLFNDRAYVDVFYQVIDNLKFGLEYARLSTDWEGDGTTYSDRIQFSAFYDF